MNILIVHPEGNFNNNPGLTSIVQILVDNGFKVDIYTPFKTYLNQTPIHAHNQLIFSEQGNFNKIVEADYSLVIGVDLGILEASLISAFKNIPLGYISYEIFFEEEAGKSVKELERIACKNIEFAICQDNIRARELSKENHIPEEKIILFPVGGLSPNLKPKNEEILNDLGIDKNKKIVLFIGSTDKFTQIDQIILSTKNWSNEWCLLVHHRYGNVLEFKQKYKGYERVHFSNYPALNFEQLSELISIADVGIALYKATYDSIFTGKNIEYIGLSSGKIATYLQNGKPVIVNNIGLYSELIRKFCAGIVLEDIDELSSALNKIDKEFLDKSSQGAISLYQEKISTLVYKQLIIETISQAIQKSKFELSMYSSSLSEQLPKLYFKIATLDFETSKNFRNLGIKKMTKLLFDALLKVQKERLKNLNFKIYSFFKPKHRPSFKKNKYN